MLEIMFNVVKPSVGSRRIGGMPSLPSQCWTRKVAWKPRNMAGTPCRAARRAADPSSWEPEVHPTESGEDDGAEKHVVKWATTNQVSHVESAGGLASSTGEPTEQEGHQEADGESIGLEGQLPFRIVPIQLKNFTPVGTAIRS
jgi:hypothetical protein